MSQKYPTLCWWLTRALLVIVVAGGFAAQQWWRHNERRREDAAMLEIDQALGATVEMLDDDIAVDLGVPPNSRGLVVTSLADGRPAERAGIQPGDVIEQIGNYAITDGEAAIDALRADRRRRITVTINRQGRDIDLDVIRD